MHSVLSKTRPKTECMKTNVLFGILTKNWFAPTFSFRWRQPAQNHCSVCSDSLYRVDHKFMGSTELPYNYQL
jgi:hypothetical protein